MERAAASFRASRPGLIFERSFEIGYRFMAVVPRVEALSGIDRTSHQRLESSFHRNACHRSYRHRSARSPSGADRMRKTFEAAFHRTASEALSCADDASL